MAQSISVPGFQLQEEPAVFVAAISGGWLLKHSTPAWRIKDPAKGFQRVVKEQRAKAIALAVLNQGRTFPNAIVLATNVKTIRHQTGAVLLPPGSRFLVVDGQHRLWAQQYSTYEATYACIVHTGLSEVEMARLFLEINDNQKRVPSSLRWDLVRLVRPEDDQFAVEAAELVYELSTTKSSPLYQRIDLTGEQGEIELKQGSLAPEIKSLVSTKKGPLKDLAFDDLYDLLERYLAGAKAVDAEGWRNGTSPLVKARVLRAVIRLLPVILDKEGLDPSKATAKDFVDYLGRIDRDSLSADTIKALQGSAGIRQLYDHMLLQLDLG